jgi:putative ABC transport system permease protein
MISEQAGDDLGVQIGDEVTVTHPQRIDRTSIAQAQTSFPVIGFHSDPFRVFAYLDASQAAGMGFSGQANELAILPTPGSPEEALKRELFALPSVAGVERATASAEFVRERMNDFLGILKVVEVFALLLALLIAFNSTSISADERARENATMMAYGVPAGRTVAIAVAESTLIGALGTAIGVGVGIGILNWVLNVTLPETLPDLGVLPSVAPGSVLAACAVGIIGVGLAPLLTARRIRRMDIPSTLRVVE